MKKVGGLWLPAEEQHLQQFLLDEKTQVDGHGTYQLHKLKAAMQYVTFFGAALDIGAHVGTWTMELAKLFERVICFEPHPLHAACWRMNLAGVNGVSLHELALGEKNGKITLSAGLSSSGDTWVDESKTRADGRELVDVDIAFLDAFDLPRIGFIKVDCEGYELPILRGARGLLVRDRPVVIVEQKEGRAEKFGFSTTGACTFLESLGATCKRVWSGDYIYKWE